MTRRTTARAASLALVGVLTLPLPAGAQHHGAPSQPYGGFQGREIKALSEKEIDDLKAGSGMGLALAAELNGYPGPAHVLELAEPLALSSGQRQRMAELFEAMKHETMALGDRLIAAEAALDRQFAGHAVTKATLDEAVRSAAVLQGELRAAHLRYHLVTVEVLTPEQVARYAALRGYGTATPAPHRHP
ncbi:Spy/CpxP family protein refolding chaperone [Reyranella sp.]|uniref:Spy/CpxP family protein refolding chaperone n=1 Tax=Reyranella sp. TaxID=1929291 RepID=UPI003BAAF5FC